MFGKYHCGCRNGCRFRKCATFHHCKWPFQADTDFSFPALGQELRNTYFRTGVDNPITRATPTKPMKMPKQTLGTDIFASIQDNDEFKFKGHFVSSGSPQSPSLPGLKYSTFMRVPKLFS